MSVSTKLYSHLLTGMSHLCVNQSYQHCAEYTSLFGFTVHFYRRRKALSRSHTPNQPEPRKNGCFSANVVVTSSQTAAHRMTLTGQWLLSPTPTWRRLPHSSPDTVSRQHLVCSPRQPVQTTCMEHSWRCTPL